MPSTAEAGSIDEEPRVPYASAVRSHQARATRRAIVVAAGDLFVEKGYAATTIDAVAERAGVGRKTVFSSVGGKGALLKLAWDWALTGDDEPIAMSERPAVQAMLAERNPARLVQMWVDMVAEVGARATPLGAVVFAAADVDSEVRALSEMIRRESLVGATAFVTHLDGIGGLRAGLSMERAAEGCWALVNSMLLHLLLGTRDWSLPEYVEWLVQVASATLLEPGGPSGAPPTTPDVRVDHDATSERYLASVAGRPAGHLAYQRTDRLLVITHTEVDTELEGRGVAGMLVRAALVDLRADGQRHVVPLCPFAAWWIRQHPDFASLVYDAGAG